VADGARELHDGKRLLLFAYPFYGRDGSNRVEPIVSFDGTRTVRAQSCAAWWADVRRLRSTEVLFWDSGRGEPSKYERWTARSPTARIVRRLPLGPPNPSSLVLYRVDSSSASPC